MPLTDPACKSAKCPADKARARYTDSGGLYLEVLPNGSKLWRWKYRFAGKEKRMALGAYPAVSLKEARTERETARLALKSGIDPVQQRVDAKTAGKVRMANNFEAVALAWFDNWKGSKSARHVVHTLRALQSDIFPTLGAKPVKDITAPNLLAMAKKIEARGTAYTARRAWQLCGQVFRYAIAHGLAERNPARDVSPSDALQPVVVTHFARLEAREMPELLRRVRAYNGSPYTRFALELMALTFVRTTELIEATWSEFDLEAAEWRIPAARMKMKAPHIVPLSTQAVEVLRGLHTLKGLSDWLFPNVRDHDKPMGNSTILQALKRMGYNGKMTGHGYRGVASTILHEHEFDHAHIELQLAHSERNAVSAAYNFATYLKARRTMMQWWADHLDELRAGAKVLPFKAA